MIKEAKGIVRRIHAQRSRVDITVPDGWKVLYDDTLHISDQSGDPYHSGKLWIKQSSTAFSAIGFDPATKTVNILYAGDQKLNEYEENWVRAKVETTGTSYEGECKTCGNLRRLYAYNHWSGYKICDDCLTELENKRRNENPL